MPEKNGIKKFSCDMCGLCCKKAESALKMKGIHPGFDEAIEAFPYTLVDGKCPKFKRNRCTVYEDRPLICRVDDLYTKFPDIAVDREAWHKQQYASCKLLKAEDAIEKDILEQERLIRFRKAMRYLGWNLSEAATELISNVHMATAKANSKLSLETLDEIQKEAYKYQAMVSHDKPAGYSVMLSDIEKIHEEN